MRFSDFVIYHALQENNRCLHVVAAHSEPLSDAAVHGLRVSVKRLRADWRLVRGDVAQSVFDAADARLKAIHRRLAPARDEFAIHAAIRGLLAKTTKKKSASALEAVADMLDRRGPERVERTTIELISQGFEIESGGWRDLDEERISEQCLLDGYVHSYRCGKRLGKRALDCDDPAVMHHWRAWVKYGYYQLDMITPVLGAENRARRWHLDRLGDALGKYHDLVMLRDRVGAMRIADADRERVDAAIDAALTVYRKRARTLHPYAYGVRRAEFAATIARDVARLQSDIVVALPRSA